MNKALIIIDVQNDYFKGGAMELFEAEKAGIEAGVIITKFREKKLPVIFVQHIANYFGATFFLPDTNGAEIHKSVIPLDNEKVFTKHYPNSFRDTGLDGYLKQQNITDLVLCGMMTHMCVDTTVRAAFDLGYSVTLIGNACATKTLEYDSFAIVAENVQKSFLAAIDGTFANVVKANEYITSMMK